MVEIMLDIMYIIGLVVAAAVGYMGLFMYYSYIARWAPEAKVFAKCRKKGYPVIEVISGGRLSWIAGIKKDKKDLMFKDQGYGLHIDARTLGHQNPLVTKGAMQVVHWSPKYAFDVTADSVRGLLAIKNHVRKNYEELSYISDIDLMTLVGTSREDLPHDCANFVDEGDTDFTADDLIVRIEKIQDEAGILPVEHGVFAFEEGIQLNPSVFLSPDVSVMMSIIRAEVMAQYKKNIDDVMKYGMAAMFVLVGAAIFMKVGGFV